MSYQKTRQTLSVLNSELQLRYDEGDPLRLHVDGRPKLHIRSFSPLVYEEYGFIRNRAPQVAGLLVLRAFLSCPLEGGGATIIAGVQVGAEGYGFTMDGYDESSKRAIVGVARALGHPDFCLNA